MLGVVGLTRFAEQTPWSLIELNTFQQIADTLSALLARLSADEALSRNDAHLRAMLDNVRELLLVVDRQGDVRYASNALGMTFGLEPDDIVGRSYLDFIDPVDQEMVISSFFQLLTESEPLTLTARAITPEGEKFWIEIQTDSKFNELLGGYAIVIRDVSEFRAAADGLRWFEEADRAISEFNHWILVNPDSLTRTEQFQAHLGKIGTVLQACSLRIGTTTPPTLAAEWTRQEPPAGELMVARLPIGKEYGFDGEIVVTREASRGPWSRTDLNIIKRMGLGLTARFQGTKLNASIVEGQAWVSALLDDTSDMITVIEQDGTIRFVNSAVERGLGYRAEDMIGTNFARVVHPDDLPRAIERLAAVFDDAPEISIRIRLIGADGNTAWWDISRGAIHSQIGGRVIVCRNAEAEVDSEATHHRRLELLSYALELSHTALEREAAEFVESLDRICAEIAEMLGVDDVMISYRDELRGLVRHRATVARSEQLDAPRFDPALSAALQARLRQVEPLVIDDLDRAEGPWMDAHRHIFGDRQASVSAGITTSAGVVGVVTFWMEDVTRTWTDDEATFARLIGETVANALERARVASALSSSEALFRALSESAADTVLLVDHRGMIRYASPSSVELTGVEAMSLIGRAVAELAHPDDPGLFPTVDALASASTLTTEGRLRRPNGTIIWVTNSTSNLPGEDGQPDQLRMSLRDTSDRKRAEQELRRQALHDPLTGVANSR